VAIVGACESFSLQHSSPHRLRTRSRDNAVAKIVASDWIDYLELARWNGQWKIVNVLWALTPKEIPLGPAPR
jgi:hypothetical protein